MTQETPLDAAHAAMQAAPDDDAIRLRFYERLAETELFMLLEAEAEEDDDTITPELFDLGAESCVLVFDREERLAAFVGRVAPYVALSGRVIAGTLAGQGIGLGVNLDVAPSSILLPGSAVDWLHQTLGNTPDEVEARIAEVRPPKGLPETLIGAIDSKLATAAGLAQRAYLVGVTYDSGARGHMLGFVGAVPEAQGALSRAAGEALTFSGIEAGAMDIGFFDAADSVAERLDRVGLRFDLPQPETLQAVRAAPGSDPDKPPLLK